MTESIKCPLCNQPLTKVGKFWICPTHGQLPEYKSFMPMRIFLGDVVSVVIRNLQTAKEFLPPSLTFGIGRLQCIVPFDHRITLIRNLKTCEME